MKNIPWKYVIPVLLAVIAIVVIGSLNKPKNTTDQAEDSPASTITPSRMAGELVEWQLSGQLVDPKLTSVTVRLVGSRTTNLDDVDTVGVEIFGVNPGRPLQVLSGLNNAPYDVKPHPYTHKFMTDKQALVVQDLTFDGYPDLRLMQQYNPDGNSTFLIWTYNPATQKFDFESEVTGILSPRADNANELMVSVQQVDEQTTISTGYTFVGGKFVPSTRTTKTYTAENTYDLTTAKYNEDGTWSDTETQTGVTETPTPAAP